MCIEQDMDGEAVSAAFGSTPGPDCLKDVVSKVGSRLRVYKALRSLYEKYQVLELCIY